jgi:hypothetical protein
MKKKICGQTSASNKASSKRIPIPVPPSIVNHGATITTESQQWPAQFCHDKTAEQNKTKHLTDSFPPSRGTETATVQCVRRRCCCFFFCQCKAQSYKNIIGKGEDKASAALQQSENNGKQRVYRTSFKRG